MGKEDPMPIEASHVSPYITGMSNPRQLTDRKALIRNRTQRIKTDALFLMDEGIHDVHERLKDVNRTFTKPAIVTHFPELWRPHFPNAVFISDEPVLDLASQSYDLVIHAMSLHWADDPVGQMIQCARALQPDGLFIGTLFGGQTLLELRQSLAMAEAEVSGGLSPRVAPMAEIRDLGALLQRVGLALPVADSVQLTTSYKDIYALMQELRHMGEANSLFDRLRTPTSRHLFEKAQTIYKTHFGTDGDRILASFEIITLTGWAPSADQPQPLRPGSATHRLADVLNTAETPTGDLIIPPKD